MKSVTIQQSEHKAQGSEHLETTTDEQKKNADGLLVILKTLRAANMKLQKELNEVKAQRDVLNTIVGRAQAKGIL